MIASTIFPRERVTIVGVLNATPDSFSDGGRLVGEAGAVNVDFAVDAAAKLVRAGAQMIDVGGESTRPGASETPAAVEIDRTAPVVEALAKRFGVAISIDTRKQPVAEAALAAGARVVNDVSGLGHDPAIAETVAATGAGLIVGHLRGTPATMQLDPHFDDVVTEVATELGNSLTRARSAGIPDERLAVDPGIGFGKRLEDNLALLAGLGRLHDLGRPIVIGTSRKGFIGTLLDRPVGERLEGTLASETIAILHGAHILRTHDVTASLRAARIADAVRLAAGEPATGRRIG